MKLRTLLVVALASTIPALACAKKPTKVSAETPVQAEPVVEEAEPVITEECLRNASIFHENTKNKMYEDAYGPWWDVYTTCPNANKSVYTDGAKIVEALFRMSKDPVEKERLANLAVELQDKRIRYFGNDTRYPKEYVLGEKGLAYVNFFDDAKVTEAHECLRTSVEALGAKSKMSVLKALIETSNTLYKQDPNNKAEQFIADYELVSGALAEQAADPNNKNAEDAGRQKDWVDNIFAQSGAADCAKLDQLYDAVVKENVNNHEMLQKITKLYKRVRCTESDVYFAACEASHKLQPTQESAAGCASMAAKKGDIEQAIAYYDQAIKLAMVEDALEDVADYQYNIAYYYYNNLKKYPEARKYAQQSIATLNGLGMNKGQGRCYLLIGLSYTATRLYGNDAKGQILNKTVYWVAVDKFVKAKQVDPSVEAQATEFINTYKKFFPTKEERFDLPNEFSGDTYYVGGWIGETTTIR